MNSGETVRVLKLVDVDLQFEFNQNQSGLEPVILNKYDLSAPEYVEQLQNLISSDGSGNDFMARCQCGATEGNNFMGQRCPVCHTEVSINNLLDDNYLICRNWISCPEELPNGWLAPKIYLILADWLTYDKRRRNYLDDILDVTTPIPHDLIDVVKGKGFQYLHDHFDRIMDFFINEHPAIRAKPDTPAMKICLQLNREKIFCHYIPILNSALSTIAGNDTGNPNKKRYTDTTADWAMKAVISLSDLFYSPKKKNHMYVVEQTAFQALKDVVAYVEEATKKYISHKKAIPRTHLFGGRMHMTFRAVVGPITTAHMPDELHVPWKLAVSTYRVHIYSKLFKQGLSINQAVAKINMALQKVDKDIKVILNSLILDSPFKGLPCLWDRPPSIRDGSMMVKRITLIKDDIDDSTISITPVDAALPNVDFDGDNLAGLVLLESEMVRRLYNLTNNHLIFDRNAGGVTSEIGINKTLTIPWNSFLGEV